jgi:DNA-directed RNA polymerase alpha subunit
MDESWIAGYMQRRAAAHAIWSNGGTTKEVAHALNVGTESARKHIKRWEREGLADRIKRAAEILISEGFAPEEVSVITGIDRRTAAYLSHRQVLDQRAKNLPAEKSHLAEDVDALELSIRASNVIKAVGAVTIADLCGLSVADLSRQKGCGKKTVDEIVSVLRQRGLKLSS